MRYNNIQITPILSVFRSLAASHASCASIKTSRCSIDYGFNSSDIGFPHFIGTSVRVRNLYSKYCCFSANLTFCHNKISLPLFKIKFSSLNMYYLIFTIYACYIILSNKRIKCKQNDDFILEMNNNFINRENLKNYYKKLKITVVINVVYCYNVKHRWYLKVLYEEL